MNRVRITSGQFGSRFIKTLPDLRPTSELVRKAIFDILGNQIEDARFLDLFAGSGSVGFEALSRGAKQATFIDNQSAHHQLLKSNAKTLAVEDLAIIRKMDVAAFLEANQTPYDIIFADPWYKDRLDISNWNRPELLTPHGLVIVEHDVKSEPTYGEAFRILNRKRYGNTALTFYTPV